MGCPHFLVATLILCGMPAAFTQRQDIVAGAILGRAADSFSTILDGGCCCSCFYWSRTASPSTAASRVLTTPHCFHNNVKRSISQPASHMLLCWGWFLGIQAPDASKLQLCRMQQHASIPQNPMHPSRCFFHPMWLSHMQILPLCTAASGNLVSSLTQLPASEVKLPECQTSSILTTAGGFPTNWGSLSAQEQASHPINLPMMQVRFWRRCSAAFAVQPGAAHSAGWSS
jgi:hypothetical protein